MNLEENSIKKGFDGYYSKDGEEWVMESKSGTLTERNKITHPGKIREAFVDLKEKLEGDTSNNPWKNAYNHASHIDVKTDKAIRLNIKKLSDNFINKEYPDISKLNIIPTSTIFLDENWQDFDLSEIKTKFKTQINNFEFNKLIIICTTKNSVNTLYEIISE